MNKVKFIFGRTFLEQWFNYGLTKEHQKELIDDILYYLQHEPDNSHGRKFPGAIIEDTGGAIKYRFTPNDYQKGKSGSFRIIYFVYDTTVNRLFFLNVYAKNKKATLSKKEKNNIKKFINQLKHQGKKD